MAVAPRASRSVKPKVDGCLNLALLEQETWCTLGWQEVLDYHAALERGPCGVRHGRERKLVGSQINHVLLTGLASDCGHEVHPLDLAINTGFGEARECHGL